MPFKYSCFISYRRQDDFVKEFMSKIKKALDHYSGLYLPPPLKAYHDADLGPGTGWKPALAEAIASSVCMVVVYEYYYETRPFCLRELAAMEILEKCRFQLCEAAIKKSGRDGEGNVEAADRAILELPRTGLIIPIVLRNADALEKGRLGARQYSDFSNYSSASRFMQNRAHMNQVEKIVQRIAGLLTAFQNVITGDVLKDCPSFRIPDESEVQPLPPVPPAFPR